MSVAPSTTTLQSATRSRRLQGLFLLLIILIGAYFTFTSLRDVRRYHAARSAEQTRDFLRAKIELEFCLSRWPTDPAVRLQAARVEWRSRLEQPFPVGWDKAARSHLKLANTEPGLFDRVSLETALLDLLAGLSNAAMKSRVVARLREGHPDEVPLLEALARSCLDSHQFTDSHEYASAILRRDPNHALAHFWRGLAFELTGRLRGESDTDYRRAVELEPQNYVFRLRLASSLALRKEHLAESRQMLDQLRLEQPDDPDVLQPLAEVLLDLGETAAARSAAEQLVKLRPRDGNANALLGQVELTTDDVVAAERHLRAAVALLPGSHAAHFQLSQCLSRIGKRDEAKSELETADRIKADRDKLAVLYRRVREHPDDPRVRYDIGMLNRRVGDVEVGAFWLRSALEIDPEFEPARKELAGRNR